MVGGGPQHFITYSADAPAKGKWYRLCHSQGLSLHLYEKATLQVINQLCADHSLRGWEEVPFPTPLHSDLDYIYTVDQDADTLIITSWDWANGAPWAIAHQMSLSTVSELTDRSMKEILKECKYVLDDYTTVRETKSRPWFCQPLDIQFGLPTSINELQEQIFTDFVYIWRFYIDDPLTWIYDMPIFRLFSIAFLRLAAWDFEISFNCPEFPAGSFDSIPPWKYPKLDIYWFHGFLVVLQEDIQSANGIDMTIEKIKSYVGDTRCSRGVTRSIIMTPRHVAFVELSRDDVLCSDAMPLLTDMSAVECSPGFRALSRILSTECWKKPRTYGETFNLPLEILQIILSYLEPQDIVSFSQASFAAEKWYYTSIPQLRDIKLCSFDSSVPCCGKRDGLDVHGVICSSCHIWKHLGCLSLAPPNSHYVCSLCQESESFTLNPGMINKRRLMKKTQGCRIQKDGSTEFFQLQLHLQLDLPISELFRSIPLSQKDFAVLFNGSYSGLSYKFGTTSR